MSEFGRELLEVIEIDMDFCNLVYGTAPCTASLDADNPRKCFNQRFTCQDPENYDRGTLTLRFTKNQTGLPKGEIVYPALKSVSTRAGEINFSGRTDKKGPLGKRAEITVQIDDFTDADFQVDKYQAERIDGTAQFSGTGYDPKSLGTFWTKFRARNPYIVGRSLRHRLGYVGEDWADMRTRHYVITEINGPDGIGGVSIKARDVLDLADNEKALAPAPSTGKLTADISDTATSFELLGDETEYDASGRIAISSEIMTYTRSGSTFTLTARGVDGTEASSHGANDLVQQCLRFESAPLYEIGRDLMQDYAGISSGFITYADWQDEGQRWQAGYFLTRTIAKPTGVTTLLAELSLFGAYWWWDEVAQEIRYRVNRPLDIPAGETYQPLIDDPTPDKATAAHVIKESARVAYKEDARLSKVLIWHGMLDPTGGQDDPANFARLTVAAVTPDADKYNQERVRKVFTPWLGQAGDETIAQPTANRLLLRYKDTRKQLTCDIDAKDAAKVELGDVVEVVSRVVTNTIGESAEQPMQVSYVEETIGGHRIKIKAEEYVFAERYGWITENTRGDYSAATDEEKELGTFIVDETTLQFADGTGPYVIF